MPKPPPLTPAMKAALIWLKNDHYSARRRHCHAPRRVTLVALMERRLAVCIDAPTYGNGDWWAITPRGMALRSDAVVEAMLRAQQRARNSSP